MPGPSGLIAGDNRQKGQKQPAGQDDPGAGQDPVGQVDGFLVHKIVSRTPCMKACCRFGVSRWLDYSLRPG